MNVLLKHLTKNEIQQPSRHGVLVPKRCSQFFPALDREDVNPRLPLSVEAHSEVSFVHYNQKTRNEYRLIGLDAEWIRIANPRDILAIRQIEDGRYSTEIFSQESTIWNRLCAFTDGVGGSMISEIEFQVCKVESSMDSFVVSIDPGEATAAQIGEVFNALSDLQRACGGLGLEFKPDGTTTVCSELTTS